MIVHAHRDAPFECCGLLIGDGDRINETRPARNVLASPIRFLVDPADHFAAVRAARAQNASIVGAYHAHPKRPATPSETDVAEWPWESCLYVIVSLEGSSAEVRAWRRNDGRVQEVRLLVDERT